MTGTCSTQRVLAPWHLATACALLATAQAAGDDSLRKLLEDTTELRNVISGTGRSTVFLQSPCSNARFAIQKTFVPYQTPAFDGAGALISGRWKQTVDEQGCGARHTLNVMVVLQDAKLSVVPLLPGSTRADPLLQKEGVKYAVQALATVPGGREPHCTVGYVADTQSLGVEDQAPPGAKAPPWRELWTLQSCTQKMLVPMQFTPDATGTSIVAGPNTAIRIVALAK